MVNTVERKAIDHQSSSYPLSSYPGSSRHSIHSHLAPCPANGLGWNAPHPQAGCHVFRKPEEIAQVWRLHGGLGGNVPAVDFQENWVLAVFAGEGRFRESLTIGRVKHTPEAIWVYVCSYTRPWQTTNPMSVIQIAKTDKPIRFVRLA